MKRPPRSALWLVATLLAAAVATPIALVALKPGRRHEFTLGPDRVFIDLPKAWSREALAQKPGGGRALLTGPLPVGTGLLAMLSQSGDPPWEVNEDRVVLHAESWTEDDLRYSLAVANLTTVAGFGVLAASSIPVLRAVGSTVAPGAVAALLFAAMLAPSALQFRGGEND